MDITLALGLASWESFWSVFFAKAGTYKIKSKKDIPEPLFILIKQLPLILYTKFPINLKKNYWFIECGSGACNETAPCEMHFLQKGASIKKNLRMIDPNPWFYTIYLFQRFCIQIFSLIIKKLNDLLHVEVTLGMALRMALKVALKNFPPTVLIKNEWGTLGFQNKMNCLKSRVTRFARDNDPGSSQMHIW